MSADSLASSGAAPAPPGPFREFWGYFSANHGAVAGLVVVVAVLLTAAFANVLAPYSPTLTNNAAFQGLQDDVRDNGEGVAMALAMAGTVSVLPDNKAMAISANWGAFEGENAGAFSGVARVQGDVFLNAGVGFSTHTTGGRAGRR